MKLLEWVGMHPILSVVLLAVLVEGIVQIVAVLAGARIIPSS
jgi:hypothetical protein